MTRTFAKIVVAGALTALPVCAVSLPASAAAASDVAHSVDSASTAWGVLQPQRRERLVGQRRFRRRRRGRLNPAGARPNQGRRR
jgi:hypothetical protein